MAPNDQGALIARSKCYLQLGEPEKALADAETALSNDKNSIRAIYQKAEALYYLGKFEHSLMFFHRGLRLRPELANFRLGVQKTQEAIEATIGGCQQRVDQRQLANLQKRDKTPPPQELPPPPPQSKNPPRVRNKEANERRQSRKLLGELFIDKEYLENLLKHPDLKRADTKTENISSYAKDAIQFLNTRQEFWRQQKPTNILSSSKAITDAIPQLSTQ
jgi:tetratricopeptide repeat protein 25